ncbi:unnamed protein product [Camellia sinensis]
MIMKKERDCRQRVIVVLDGIKASTEKRGVAPLRYALREVVGPRDELLVILAVHNSECNVVKGGCYCMGDEQGFDEQFSSEGGEDSYIKFLHEEMCQRKEAFANIFRPYYDICKTNGVKFQVKIVTIFEPKALLVDEANYVDATLIVMDRCFARDQSFQLCQIQYNVTLVSGDGDIVAHKTLPLRVSETSSSKQSDDKGLISPHESHFHFNFPNSKTKSQPFLPYHASTSKQGENHPIMFESSSKNKTLSDDHNISSVGFSEVNLVMRMPLQLSWEMVKEITGGFTRMTCFDENENFKTYCGYLSDHHSQVLVRRFTGQLDCVLKAEKKAALFMHHKNILGLSGYYKGKNGTILVYPFTRKWTLDRFLHVHSHMHKIGAQNRDNDVDAQKQRIYSKGKQRTKMTFQEKIKIAIGIGEGVRYMHEECPRGPIVHGNLRPCNIFLNFDLEPQITGFGNAKWLHLKQGLPISSNRFWHTDPSDHESLALLKFDMIHFGILLLRLFCKRSAPRDDKIFVDWARPLLLQRAFHKLLDEDMEDLDVYGIFRVIEIISVLKGETSCAMQLSPSSEGSPNMDFSGSSIGRLVCNLTSEL